MSEPVRVHLDPDYVYTYSALSVFWPESEFHALIARWPQLADHLGASWDEHRRRVERHCALCERGGLRVELLPADVPGFAAFLADRGVTSPEKDDLLAHPDLRSVTTAMLGLAARPDGSLLVRVGAQVQAVLSAARTR